MLGICSVFDQWKQVEPKIKMHGLVAKFIGIALIVCVLHNHGVCGETWGNIYTTSKIDTLNVHKFAIPLFVREAIVEFPAVSDIY